MPPPCQLPGSKVAVTNGPWEYHRCRLVPVNAPLVSCLYTALGSQTGASRLKSNKPTFSSRAEYEGEGYNTTRIVPSIPPHPDTSAPVSTLPPSTWSWRLHSMPFTPRHTLFLPLYSFLFNVAFSLSKFPLFIGVRIIWVSVGEPKYEIMKRTVERPT